MEPGSQAARNQMRLVKVSRQACHVEVDTVAEALLHRSFLATSTPSRTGHGFTGPPPLSRIDIAAASNSSIPHNTATKPRGIMSPAAVGTEDQVITQAGTRASNQCEVKQELTSSRHHARRDD
jgi:hypothetical protein